MYFPSGSLQSFIELLILMYHIKGRETTLKVKEMGAVGSCLWEHPDQACKTALTSTSKTCLELGSQGMSTLEYRPGS